jgi:hypothetical protein
MNMAKLKNLSSLQSRISTWATSAMGIEWLTAIKLVGKHVSGQKFFHLLDLIILNSYIMLSSCSNRMVHKKFYMIWFKICCKWVQGELIINPSPWWRKNPHINQMIQLQIWLIKQWRIARLYLQCHMCPVCHKLKLTNFIVQNVKLQCACTHVSEFTTWNYISESQDHYTMQKKLPMKCVWHFIITFIYYFIKNNTL